ncbi:MULTISPECIES: cob(I)yrinic acid a,c-diamide adenosyltransferase [Mitsuokella]|uniref:cob(I)yrinic acid a,c-diamide adenosyltransferase n=1 Tax=Mitsuokella TaxID=52225 RepID=UPI0020D07709|nr:MULTISPECIES: cob(I)yrinic acid a,c-diamide adenosyltransferase [Mitsuokella]MCI7184772.1 cob(I)yrinic acid a,c-diamide adenosyltransferase [Mitsuokella jalaludinii]MCQ1532551.1 cob(I)yrinic acid a,c-diamide adenosyltransferase [Mitsuokella jalaludinii]
MSITTKTGDNGETSLLTGERVKKSGLRVDTYGTLDEVDSALGLARAFSDKDDVAERILKLQRKLPALMADFASCGTEPRITMEDVREIESWCDDVESDLPEEHAFIIPGGSQSGAMLDLARTTARRAERCACRLAEAEEVAASDRIYLNRLSDYCYLLMRLEEDIYEDD